MARPISKPLLWTQGETNFLRRNYRKVPSKEIAKRLGRTTQSVICKAKRSGLSRSFKSWILQETDFLKENYSKLTAQEIGERLERDERSVHSKAAREGIKKTSLRWNPKPENLAWLACAIDSEGSVMLQNDKNARWTARITINNTHRDFVEHGKRLCKAGSITDEINRNGCKPIFRFTLNSNGCRKVLPHIFPYLIVKRRQALLLLEALPLLKKNMSLARYNRSEFIYNTNCLKDIANQISILNGGKSLENTAH